MLYMRNLNLKRLSILSEVTQTVNGVAKMSSQAVDVGARLFALILEALPAFQRRGRPQSAQSRPCPAHPSGFRLSQIWDSAEMQGEQVSTSQCRGGCILVAFGSLEPDFKTLPAPTAL